MLVMTDRIKPNPWQTRQGTDPEHIGELAADIAARYDTRPTTCGLLQVPLGRLVNAQGKPVPKADVLAILHLGDVTPNLEEHDYYVQLAFGHNRLAAFTLLSNGDSPLPGEGPGEGEKFTHFPVEYTDFTDEEMATAAWTENAKRKDLSALEEALAIRRAQTDFGWSNTEISKRWGMAPSTISNKLRLLALPDAVQTDVGTGAISERQAMAIVPAFELLDTPLLPNEARDQIKDHWFSPDKLVERAKEGANSDRLRSNTNQLTLSVTQALADAIFPLDEFLTYKDGAGAPCTNCNLVVKHKGQSRCPNSSCWQAKTDVWIKKRLAAASEATGLPIAPIDISWQEKETFSGNETATLGQKIFAQKDHCENLTLWYSPDTDYGVRVPNFRDVRVICHHKGQSSCKCLSQTKSAATREKNANDPAIQARKKREKEVKALVKPATQTLATALQELHPGAWRLLYPKVIYRTASTDWSINQITNKIAGCIIKGLYSYSDTDQPDRTRNIIAAEFNKIGLPLPWPEISPLDQIKLKFDRIESWMRNLSTVPMPTTAAFKGNVENLAKLELELNDIEPSDERTEIEERIVSLLDVLYDLRPISERWDGIEDGQEWDQHGNWIVNVPAGDSNFKSHLDQITRPNVIEYAAALLGMQRETKTKFKALDHRLRLLEKPGEEVEQ